MQSEPVSPPPMTTTSRPLALIVPCGAALDSLSPATRLFCWVRKSIAKWMPSSVRPSMSRSRGSSAPPDAAGELREVAGGVQRLQRAAPALAIDQIVEVRDQVVDRATVVTIRDAAI